MMTNTDAYDYRAPIVRAIEAAGGVTRLAKLIGVTHPAILQWKETPPKRVLAVEAATECRVTRYELRPDLYPPHPSAHSHGR